MIRQFKSAIKKKAKFAPNSNANASAVKSVVESKKAVKFAPRVQTFEYEKEPPVGDQLSNFQLGASTSPHQRSQAQQSGKLPSKEAPDDYFRRFLQKRGSHHNSQQEKDQALFNSLASSTATPSDKADQSSTSNVGESFLKRRMNQKMNQKFMEDKEFLERHSLGGRQRKRYGPRGIFTVDGNNNDTFVQDEPSDDDQALIREKQRDIENGDYSDFDDEDDGSANYSDEHPLDRRTANLAADSDDFEDYGAGGEPTPSTKKQKEKEEMFKKRGVGKYYKLSEKDVIQQQIDANLGFDEDEFKDKRRRGVKQDRKKVQSAAKAYFQPLKDKKPGDGKKSRSNGAAAKATITIEEPENFNFVFREKTATSKLAPSPAKPFSVSMVKPTSTTIPTLAHTPIVRKTGQSATKNKSCPVQMVSQEPVKMVSQTTATSSSQQKPSTTVPHLEKQQRPEKPIDPFSAKQKQSSSKVPQKRKRSKVVMVEVEEEEEDFNFDFKPSEQPSTSKTATERPPKATESSAPEISIIIEDDSTSLKKATASTNLIDLQADIEMVGSQDGENDNRSEETDDLIITNELPDVEESKIVVDQQALPDEPISQAPIDQSKPTQVTIEERMGTRPIVTDKVDHPVDTLSLPAMPDALTVEKCDLKRPSEPKATTPQQPALLSIECDYSKNQSQQSMQKTTAATPPPSETVITLTMDGQFQSESSLIQQAPIQKKQDEDSQHEDEDSQVLLDNQGEEEDADRTSDGQTGAVPCDTEQRKMILELQEEESTDSGLEFCTPVQDFEIQNPEEKKKKAAKEKAKKRIKAAKVKMARRKKKPHADNDNETMTIEGCYFPTEDEIMRSSGNESEESDSTYRTFLDEQEKKHAQTPKQGDQTHKREKAPKTKPQLKKKFRLEKSPCGQRKKRFTSNPRTVPKKLSRGEFYNRNERYILQQEARQQKEFNFKATQQDINSAFEAVKKPPKQNAFGMDDLLMNSLNLAKDFKLQEDVVLDETYHNQKLKQKLDRHEKRSHLDGEHMTYRNEFDSDDDEVDALGEPDPDRLVGKAGPEFPVKHIAPNGVYAGTQAQDLFVPASTGEINLNSDSCSAVSSNSEEDKESNSGSDSDSGRDQNGFSSCSDDSDGTKQKIQKKVKALISKKKSLEKPKDTNRQGDRVSKKYKRFVMKANKVLTASKNQMTNWNFGSRESIRYCYLKAIDYYKKALKHSRSDRDKGRIFVLIAQTQISLTPRIYERDQRSKSIQKAVFYLGLTLKTCSDFDHKVIGDLEEQIKYLCVKQIKDSYENPELLCMVFEMIQQNTHERMTRLLKYVVNELYKLYYKIASDQIDLRSDTTNARKYLAQCQALDAKHSIFNPQEIDKKLEECKEIESEQKSKGCRRQGPRAKDPQAWSSLESGLKLLGVKSNDEAIKQFRRCLHYAKQKEDTEAECLANYHLGETFYKIGKELEKARAHLVDFQILCQMQSQKSAELSSKFKQASHLINQIMTQINQANYLKQKKKQQFLNAQHKVNKGSNQSAQKNPQRQSSGTSHKAAASQKQKPKPLLNTKTLLEEVDKQATSTASKFIKFLFGKFPEKTSHLDISKLTLGCNRQIIRKCILRFIGVFHPDKQRAAAEISDRFRNIDMLRVTEEITKHLNLFLGKH